MGSTGTPVTDKLPHTRDAGVCVLCVRVQVGAQGYQYGECRIPS